MNFTKTWDALFDPHGETLITLGNIPDGEEVKRSFSKADDRVWTATVVQKCALWTRTMTICDALSVPHLEIVRDVF